MYRLRSDLPCWERRHAQLRRSVGQESQPLRCSRNDRLGRHGVRGAIGHRPVADWSQMRHEHDRWITARKGDWTHRSLHALDRRRSHRRGGEGAPRGHADQMIEAMISAVQSFATGAPQNDDVTALVLRYLKA